jgi:catechol 2,3-dioxygenase-like lactoylglutathione lyase family enzyme
MSIILKHITAVLPSSDLERDIEWYEVHLGFKFHMGQEGYAVLHRDNQWLHLQWHAGTDEDPLIGGSVVKIFVEDIQKIFEEMLVRGSVTKGSLRKNTSWGTHEFGLYDLNKNVIFFVADIN